MNKNKRDDFSSKNKDILAKRAAYICSNSVCRDLTIEPHSNKEKIVITGVAAHICAASPKGPRFDSDQTDEERKNIDNGIWLCANCAYMIDKDEKKYTRELLIEWKIKHENYVKNKGMNPDLPEIKLKTLHGLTLDSTQEITITGKDVEKYREHSLVIENKNDIILHNTKIRIQFPEVIIGFRKKQIPPGIDIRIEPEKHEWIFSGTGNIQIKGKPIGYENFNIQIDKVPPHNIIEIAFLSILNEQKVEENIMERFNNEGLIFHITGSFQFKLRDTFMSRSLVVPLDYNENQRQVTSDKCEERNGKTKIIIYNRLL